MAKQKCTVNGSDELLRPDGSFLAFVSPEDAERLSLFRWHKSGRYVARSFVVEGKQVLELLQRNIALAMGADPVALQTSTVRFKDRNPRNCRRENLIVVPRKESKLRDDDETLSEQLELAVEPAAEVA